MPSLLIIGQALDTDAGVSTTLQRFGVDEIVRVPDLEAGLALLSSRHLDFVFVEADALEEAELAQLDRAGRRERNTEIVGTAPTADPQTMLRAMRAGIQEFLVRPVAPADLGAAMERLMRRRTTAPAAGELVAAYSAKGGVGVSSVVSNLAAALAALPRAHRVAVADFVLPGGEQRLHFNINPVYDIGHAASKADRLDIELLNSVLAPARDGVWLLASSDDPEVDERVDASVASAILGHLRGSFHHTVVDCERQLNERTLAVLDAADRVLLVTQLNVSALRSAQRSLQIFRRLGYPNGKLCVIVNRYQSGDVLSVSDAEDLLKTEIYFRLPNDYKLMAEANSRGLTAQQVDASAKVSQAFVALASKLTGSDESPANGHVGSRLRNLFTRKK